ncbi:MAG: glycosyltransferase family 2 protein [Phycisphaerales bacterium]
MTPPSAPSVTPGSHRLSILVPVFNERPLVGAALARLDAAAPALADLGLSREIIIVDDGSTDGTADELSRLAQGRDDVRVLKHPVNLGKGAALRTAMRAATGDVVIIHDADAEYDPRDHPTVLAPILDGRADAVIGSRFIGSTHRVLYFWHSVVNRGVTLLSNITTNLNLTDIECCTKAFRRQVAERIEIEENRFGVEPELVAKIARLRIDGRAARVYEVGVNYDGRTYAEGKKIGWKDGVAALWCVLKYGALRRGTEKAGTEARRHEGTE